MDGIQGVAASISEEFCRLLPGQRKAQRSNLSLLVATMLDVRSANLMDLAAGLPRAAERIDMRYQWIARVLMNPLIDPDAVMAPFVGEVLGRLAAQGQPLVLILDQSKLSDRHQALMLAVRHGERALPLLWRVEATEGAIGFAVGTIRNFVLVGVILKQKEPLHGPTQRCRYPGCDPRPVAGWR
jgi:hypothetical protein